MSKKLSILIILFLCLFITTACSNKPKTLILFNRYPITKETMLNNATEFDAGKKFYYIFLTQEPIDAKLVRVKIYKREEKANYRVTDLVYSNDFKVMKDEIYYYTDYLVMHDAGYYYMAIFAINNMRKPLAVADFKIK